MPKKSPFVYWAQTASHIHLKVDLKHVDKDSLVLNVDAESVEFKGCGVGANGSADFYEFDLEFFLPIEAEHSSYRVLDNQVKVSLKKADDGDWWPRLLHDQRKLAWLKLDFDRWMDFDADKDESDNDPDSMDFLRSQYPQVYKDLQDRELTPRWEAPKKIYLFFYYLFQFCGFAYVFCIMALRYSRMGEDFFPETWAALSDVVKMLHLMMILEILHPLFGYTNGSTFQAMIHVANRNFIIFGIDGESRMHEKPFVFYIFGLYAVIELSRYPYYLLRVYHVRVDLLTWIRHTIWIPMYPATFICEAVIAFMAVRYYEQTEKFCVSLPNAWNFAFYFPNLLRGYLLFYSFPSLITKMNHSYNVRCKRLNIKQYSKKGKKFYEYFLDAFVIKSD